MLTVFRFLVVVGVLRSSPTTALVRLDGSVIFMIGVGIGCLGFMLNIMVSDAGIPESVSSLAPSSSSLLVPPLDSSASSEMAAM